MKSMYPHEYIVNFDKKHNETNVTIMKTRTYIYAIRFQFGFFYWDFGDTPLTTITKLTLILSFSFLPNYSQLRRIFRLSSPITV